MVTKTYYSAARAKIASRSGLALIGATLLLLSAGTQAHEVNQKAVRYEDLNLSQPADVGVLYGRLRTAANQVCAHYDSRDLRLRALQRACVADALNKAVAEVNAGALTGLHQADRTMRIAQGAAAKLRS